jgi:shikimate kinase
MKLIFIYGPPAVGKLTVATELAALTGLKLFHNQMTVDLALAFFEFASPGFMRVVDTMRMAVFEAAAAEPLDGLIFTFVFAADRDDDWVQEVVAAVERHGGAVCFVRLVCEPEVLLERVTLPERRRFRKLNDPEKLRALMERRELLSPLPYGESLTLDTARLTPQEAARQIAAHYGLERTPDASDG